jgi:hypothetical protein
MLGKIRNNSGLLKMHGKCRKSAGFWKFQSGHYVCQKWQVLAVGGEELRQAIVIMVR